METSLITKSEWKCKFRNGTWRCTPLNSSISKPTLWMQGGSDFFDTPGVQEGFEDFVKRMAATSAEAANYAMRSAYAADIEMGGGLMLDSVVIEVWDDFKVWFLLSSSDRMVGVRVVNDKPKDIYCDHL